MQYPLKFIVQWIVISMRENHVKFIQNYLRMHSHSDREKRIEGDNFFVVYRGLPCWAAYPPRGKFIKETKKNVILRQFSYPCPTQSKKNLANPWKRVVEKVSQYAFPHLIPSECLKPSSEIGSIQSRFTENWTGHCKSMDCDPHSGWIKLWYWIILGTRFSYLFYMI